MNASQPIPACPSWCDDEPGHPYSCVVGDDQLRVHGASFYRSLRPLVGGLPAEVWLQADELRLAAGGHLLDLPMVYVFADGITMSADEARELAAHLTQAADALDRLP